MKLALVALAALLATPVVLAGHSESARYVYDPALVSCASGVARTLGLNQAGACFAPQRGESSVAVSVVDDAFGALGGVVQQSDAHGVLLGETPFCGSTSVALLPGVTTVKVVLQLDNPAMPAFPCATFGTTGTITATFA